MEANAYAGSDTIHLPAGTYTLTRVGEDDTAVNGDLDILEELTITGEGNDHTIIDANGPIIQDRAFFIAVGVVAVIQGVRIQNGFTQLNGGGILNNGQLTLSNLAITDSHGNHGGAIASTAPLVIYDSLIVNNSAQYHGGGVINYDDLEMRGVTMSSNDAPDDGGAIYYISVDSNIRITNSSIFNNVADHGGALAGSAGRVLILGSRISGNSARFYGGALTLTDSVVDVYNTTISGNWTNGTGGAISIGNSNNSLEDAINLYNTTIAGNKSNNDNTG
jgi:hypothetical protein